MTYRLKTTLIAASAALTLSATSAIAQSFPSDYTALDADKNGQVTFAEYSAVVKTSGLTTTAAAQQFTRISAGDAIITEDELNLALAFQDQPYALQNVNSGADISYASTAPEFEPPVSEVQDSPIMDAKPIVVEEAPADITIETPAPEIETPREPVPEMTEPTTAATQPKLILKEAAEPELPDAEIAAPEEAGDVLLEDELEPAPEG